MTTSSYFKQNLLEIEQKLRGLQDTDQNSIKIRMDVMTDLYCVLHSKQAVTYFLSIYRRTGAHNATIAKDIEDYISEAWTEAFRCYDPNKGALLPFLAIRIQNKIIDDERKMGGMVGLPRNGQERAKLNFISVDQDNAAAGTQDIKHGILDDYSFRRYNGEEVLENELRDLLVSKWLHSLAATILQFENKYPLQTWKELEIDHNTSSNIRKKKKYFYYRLFYSSDIISYIKENMSTAGFCYERETMSAMHLGFTNFCTDRSVPYHDSNEITPLTILVRPLARNVDVFPDGYITWSDRDTRLSVPIQNEVIRKYMECIESVQVSSSNISQMKHKYRCELRELLQVH